MSTVKHTRLILAEKLEKLLPKDKYVLFPNRDSRDEIERPTLILVRSQINPLPEVAPSAYRANTFQLLVVSPVTTDDAMDDLVDEVLDAIAELPNAFFSDATPGVFEDKRCYEITLTFPDDRQTPSTTTTETEA